MLECSSVTDIDYSAACSVRGLIEFVHARDAYFGIMGAAPALLSPMHTLGITGSFADFDEVASAYESDAPTGGVS